MSSAIKVFIASTTSGLLAPEPTVTAGLATALRLCAASRGKDLWPQSAKRARATLKSASVNCYTQLPPNGDSDGGKRMRRLLRLPDAAALCTTDNPALPARPTPALTSKLPEPDKP